MVASVLPAPKWRNLAKACFIPSLLASISSTERIWRVSSLPEGSPTRVVPPPISTIGLPPHFCSQCSIMMEMRLPTCSEGAVQS